MTYIASKSAVLGYGTVLSIGPLASAGGSPTYVPINEVNDLKIGGYKRNVIMVTNFNSPLNSVEKRGVSLDYGTVTATINYIPDDPGQVALMAAHTTGNGQPFKFTVQEPVDTPDGESTAGPLLSFNAIISEYGGMDISLTKQSEYTLTLDITGVPTFPAGS